MSALISGFGGMAVADQKRHADIVQLKSETDAGIRNERLKAMGAQEQGDFGASRARMLGSQMVAQQRVGYANSGIDEKSGTAAAVQADTTALSETDAQQIANNAAREVWGHRQNIETIRKGYASKMDQLDAEYAGSLLTGFAGTYGKGLDMGMKFMGGGG